MAKRTELDVVLDRLEEAYEESIRAPEYGEYLKAREAVKALVRGMLIAMWGSEKHTSSKAIADLADAILNEPEDGNA